MNLITSQPAIIVALLLAVSASLTDLRSRRVPNALVAFGALAGLGAQAVTYGGPGVTRALLGGLVGFVVFLPFFLLRGMGGGDVKLMGALGVCLGPLAIVQVALVAALIGGVLALATAARHGAVIRTIHNIGRLFGYWCGLAPSTEQDLTLDNPKALKIPYALPIAAGAFFIVFTG